MLAAVYRAPLGLDVPAPRPLPPVARSPPLPAGGQFKPVRAGRRCLGLAGGGSRCRQKTAAVRGRGPAPGGGASRCGPTSTRAPPTAPARQTRAGARCCRPRVPRLRTPPVSLPRRLPWERCSGPASGGVCLLLLQLLLLPGAAARAALLCAPRSSFARASRGGWSSNTSGPYALWARLGLTLTQKSTPRASQHFGVLHRSRECYMPTICVSLKS